MGRPPRPVLKQRRLRPAWYGCRRRPDAERASRPRQPRHLTRHPGPPRRPRGRRPGRPLLRRYRQPEGCAADHSAKVVGATSNTYYPISGHAHIDLASEMEATAPDVLRRGGDRVRPARTRLSTRPIPTTPQIICRVQAVAVSAEGHDISATVDETQARLRGAAGLVADHPRPHRLARRPAHQDREGMDCHAEATPDGTAVCVGPGDRQPLERRSRASAGRLRHEGPQLALSRVHGARRLLGPAARTGQARRRRRRGVFRWPDGPGTGPPDMVQLDPRIHPCLAPGRL